MHGRQAHPRGWGANARLEASPRPLPPPTRRRVAVASRQRPVRHRRLGSTGHEPQPPPRPHRTTARWPNRQKSTFPVRVTDDTGST